MAAFGKEQTKVNKLNLTTRSDFIKTLTHCKLLNLYVRIDIVLLYCKIILKFLTTLILISSENIFLHVIVIKLFARLGPFPTYYITNTMRPRYKVNKMDQRSIQAYTNLFNKATMNRGNHKTIYWSRFSQWKCAVADAPDPVL